MKNKTWLTLLIALGAAMGFFLLGWLAPVWLDEIGLMWLDLVLLTASVVVVSVCACFLWIARKVKRAIDPTHILVSGDSHVTGSFYAHFQDGILRSFFAEKRKGAGDPSRTRRARKTHTRFF